MFSMREVEVHQKEPTLSYLQNIHPDPKICVPQSCLSCAWEAGKGDAIFKSGVKASSGAELRAEASLQKMELQESL